VLTGPDSGYRRSKGSKISYPQERPFARAKKGSHVQAFPMELGGFEPPIFLDAISKKALSTGACASSFGLGLKFDRRLTTSFRR
jgi:hypothetical protein